MLEEKCIELYHQGYNCAEAMIRAANEVYGLNISSDDIKLFSGYGLGMGSLLTCGLATVGVAIFSRITVIDKAHDTPQFMAEVHRYMEGFAQAVGSNSCDALRKLQYDRVTKCEKSVRLACQYTEQFLQQHNLI